MAEVKETDLQNSEIMQEAYAYIIERGSLYPEKDSIKFNPAKIPERIREAVDVLLIELQARKVLADAIKKADLQKTRILEPDFCRSDLRVIERVQGIITEYTKRN